MADNTRYAFVRSSTGFPGSSAIPDPYGGVVFASQDPNLAQAMKWARNQGRRAGIYVETPFASQDPESYAAMMYQLAQQYGPDLLVADLEAEAKGYPDSPQWDWNRRFSDAWHRVAPNQATAVTVMPNQDDFNYGAYTQYGIPIWAQSYGANSYTEQYDPAQTYQRLRANGVPAELAQVVLAPGQSYTGPGGAAFTLDDLLTGRPGITWNDAATGPEAAPAPASEVAPAPEPTGQVEHVPTPPDQQDRRDAYAKRRLRQAQSAGLIKGMPTPGNYAAAWRRLSATLAEPAAAAGFRDPGFWLRQAAAQHTLTPTGGSGGRGMSAYRLPPGSPPPQGNGAYAPAPALPSGAPAPGGESALDIARRDIAERLAQLRRGA